MYKILVLFTFVSLVFSQTGTTTNPCPKPCYGANTNPCLTTDLVCVKPNITDPLNKPLCETQCVKVGATAADISTAFLTCASPCQTPSYLCSSNEVCKTITTTLVGTTTTSTCYNCIPLCDPATVCGSVKPCDSNTAAKDCASKLSTTSNVATCVDNFCGGCKAEWYLAGVRVCENAITCPVCNTACPANTLPVKDPNTGCVICGKCNPICPDALCTLSCPYGYVIDPITNCKKCECNKCPPAGFCSNVCSNGFKIDATTGCQTCDCNTPTCIPLDTTNCNISCPNGFVIDTNGCKLCKCRECPALSCPATSPICKAGNYIDKVSGCPTCDCLPTCTNVCPYGYDFSSTTTNVGTTGVASTYCKCVCPAVKCLSDCKVGYKYDQFGCQTCDCIPDYTVCTAIACDVKCDYGYAPDAKGCPTCSCNPKPVCSAVDCANVAACPYGYFVDENGCKTCKCMPCPAVACLRYCPYGYQYNKTTGCPTCACNDAPICPLGVGSAFKCSLNCAKGYVSTNGCPECKCTDVVPCTCDSIKHSTEVLTCPDGVSFQKETDICVRDASANSCSYQKTLCPIVIGVTLPKGISLTSSDIEAICLKVVTNPADCSVTKKDNADSSVTYSFTFNQSGLVPGSKATDVNNQVGSGAKTVNNGATSYVVSDGVANPGNNFGHILAPLFALFVVLFF